MQRNIQSFFYLALLLGLFAICVSGEEEEWAPCKSRSLDVCVFSVIPKCEIIGDKCKPVACKRIKQKNRCGGVCDW